MNVKRTFIGLSGNIPNTGEYPVIDQDTITKETYEEYVALCGRLKDFENAEDKFVILKMNTEILENHLEKITAIYTEPLDDSQYLLNRIWANSFATAFFTVLVIFDEHTELRLRTAYGEASEPYRIYKSTRANEFDGHFEYRFSCKMRNYLHCDLPLNHFIVGGFFDHPTENYYQNQIGFDPEVLLSNHFDWKTMKNELISLREYIPATGFFRKSFESVERINQIVSETEMKLLINDAQRIRQIISKALVQELTDIGIGIYTEYDNATSNANICYTPVRVMKRLGVI